ncbi:recombination protein RecT [Aerococcus sp. 150760007-1]|uniref:Recombinase RecT n=1 Tax=Aerococcus urinaeequi TaxID=51665 RepID=A0ABR5ZY51_9LACT|nr:recombinase RecT [Aerococcus urinaeequi]MBA5829537.1 recombinase RecT [Aerococcus urinaeequi]MBA5860356.1 recombinase RecT [Aerococcus urinaeequi]
MTNQLVNQNNSVQGLLKNPAIQKKFNDVLKDKSNSFTSSLISLVNGDGNLSDSEPMSIVASAMQAAQLDLPIEKQFGFAYIVPFNAKNKQTGQWEKKAQFMLGYRGYIQLAQRSGQYQSINVISVYDGQLESWNPLTEQAKFNPDNQISDEVVGYIGYFKLLNGFEKTTYWTKEQVEKHRIENNKGKDKRKLTGVWASNYDAMAQKTVLRNLLSKWGILSIEMQQGVLADDTVSDIDNDGQIQRVDVTESVDDVQVEINQNANTEELDFNQSEDPFPIQEEQIAPKSNNFKPKAETTPASKGFEDIEPGF